MRTGRGVYTYQKFCRRFGDDFEGRLMFRLLEKADALIWTPGQSPFAIPRPSQTSTFALKPILEAKEKLKQEIRNQLLSLTIKKNNPPN